MRSPIVPNATASGDRPPVFSRRIRSSSTRGSEGRDWSSRYVGSLRLPGSGHFSLTGVAGAPLPADTDTPLDGNFSLVRCPCSTSSPPAHQSATGSQICRSWVCAGAGAPSVPNETWLST